ncbi:MAG: glutaminyl-peptide cyclotransferase [Rikenellaceae bacterium]
MANKLTYLNALLLLLLTSCFGGAQSSAQSSSAEQPRRYTYIVKATYPHATDSYTQGLQIVDGELFEGTGMEGESRLMRVELKSGKQQLLAKLPDNEFGEGITILGDTIYMLTWQSGVMHLFSRKSGEQIDRRLYAGEGWGLTSDGESLYMSNGSSRIMVRDRESFNLISSHSVTLDGEPIPYLNELEWIEGKIWANVYTTDQIVIIDPSTWQVSGVVDLTALLPTSERTPTTDVLNGIAYDEATKKIYVTGKNWSKIFEIEIVKI